MMKFSIIIPVYNAEMYLEKCLKSIINQTYFNYEVIIIDDGSTDNSAKIIKNISNDRFKYYYKKNSGVADTRNFGVSKAIGDYILFLDADDFFEINLLETISKNISNQDIIKYNARLVDKNNNLLKSYNIIPHNGLTPYDALKNYLQDELVDVFWIYAFKRDFWVKNNFKCMSGKVHEDFGLIPLILLCADNMSTIDFVGYNYVEVDNSITRNYNVSKIKKRYIDSLIQYKDLVSKIYISKELQCKKDLILIYITHSIVKRYSDLPSNLKKDLNFKSERIYKNLPSNNIKRYIKKYALMFNYKLYLFITKIGRK